MTWNEIVSSYTKEARWDLVSNAMKKMVTGMSLKRDNGMFFNVRFSSDKIRPEEVGLTSHNITFCSLSLAEDFIDDIYNGSLDSSITDVYGDNIKFIDRDYAKPYTHSLSKILFNSPVNGQITEGVIRGQDDRNRSSN